MCGYACGGVVAASTGMALIGRGGGCLDWDRAGIHLLSDALRCCY